MSILESMKKETKKKDTPSVKVMLVHGQEVEVKCYAETRKRPRSNMRTKGKQTHDAALTAHMSIQDISSVKKSS